MPLPLTTERLLLRPAAIDDLEAWHAIAQDAEEAWFGAASSTLDDSQARLEKHVQHQESHGFALWVVELRSTGEVIGITGVTHLEDGPRDRSRLSLPAQVLGPRICDRGGEGVTCLRAGRIGPRANRRRHETRQPCLATCDGEMRAALRRHDARLRRRARQVRRLPLEFAPVAGSSNGRTPGSGPGSLGSNPSPAAL